MECSALGSRQESVIDEGIGAVTAIECFTAYRIQVAPNSLNLLGLQRAGRTTKYGTGDLSHQPKRDLHTLMRTAARFTKVVDEPCKRRDGALRFLGPGQVTGHASVDQPYHQFGCEARESNQCTVTR